MTEVVRAFVPAESVEEQWDLAGLQQVLADEWSLQLDLAGLVSAASEITDAEVLDHVLQAANAAYEAKVALVGREQMGNFERVVLLQHIDSNWRDHLSALDYLRQGIHLRGYAQKQPKQEYKREAFQLFGMLLDTVRNEVTRLLMNVKIQSPEQVGQAAEQLESQAEQLSHVTYTAPTETGEPETLADSGLLTQSAQEVPRVGRNDPCPCGSGLKYKACHGKLS